jgi:hypothetical protein
MMKINRKILQVMGHKNNMYKKIYSLNMFLFLSETQSSLLLFSESTLVSGSLDMTVRIWDLRSGQQIR